MKLPKFRCKNKIGNWFFFTVLHNGNVNEENFDLETLSQFTGLLDKQGVEIYECDIIKDDEDRFFEVKEDLRFAKTGYIMSCIKNKLNDHINLGGFNDFWSWMYPDNYIEVIGNIYENHELLEN